MEAPAVQSPRSVNPSSVQARHQRAHYLMLMYCFHTAWLWEIQILGTTDTNISQSNKEKTILHYHSWKLLGDNEGTVAWIYLCFCIYSESVS